MRHAANACVVRNAFTILAGELQAKRPLARPRHRLKDHIKIGFREQGTKVDTANK